MHKKDWEKKGRGRECQTSSNGSHDAVFPQNSTMAWEEKKEEKNPTINVVCHSCSVVSLGLN